mgnify:CR=1 FL=1
MGAPAMHLRLPPVRRESTEETAESSVVRNLYDPYSPPPSELRGMVGG